MQSIPVVDTYLRQEPFSRALLFAASAERPVIVLGQPLAAAQMLFTHSQSDDIFPAEVLIIVGGYHCPRSLELFVADLLLRSGTTVFFVHAYGSSDLGFGCLAGMRSQCSIDIPYRPCRLDLRFKIEKPTKKLFLKLESEKTWLDTEDRAYVTQVKPEKQIIIRNDSSKLHPEVLDELESWDQAAWSRRTGCISRSAQELKVQLRRGLTPLRHIFVSEWFLPIVELEHYEFCRECEWAWSEKPNWS